MRIFAKLSAQGHLWRRNRQAAKFVQLYISGIGFQTAGSQSPPDGTSITLTVQNTARGASVSSTARGSSHAHPSFFIGETPLSNGVYYLTFSNNIFGYYVYPSDLRNIFHFDLGYEYVFDANDGKNGVFLYDFKSGSFFYTSPSFGFPYLYDFSLGATLYYYPDTKNSGHYTSGPRYFFNFKTGQIITK